MDGSVSVRLCYLVSDVHGFVLVMFCLDMLAWLALTQQIFAIHAILRNIKAFFSLKRGKFDSRLALQLPSLR
jgi:hypothetical protein